MTIVDGELVPVVDPVVLVSLLARSAGRDIGLDDRAR
jgi:hypothetical protein